MNINKQQLLAIRNLDLYEINKMNDSDYDNYCTRLEEFVEKFPTQEAELKNLFAANDLSGFARTLWALSETFSAIYAVDLLKKCETLSVDIKNPNRDMAEACLTYFLTSVSMLSIEIQMARHKSPEEAPAEVTPEVAVLQYDTEIVTRQKSILAVDDVSLLLNTLRGMLQGTQYRFTGVTSGDAALRFVQGHDADLFLLDIEMPGMDGYQLAAKLKQMGQTAPIVFLTGNAQSKYVLKAMQMGAADFIVKPINKEQVLEKIKKYIG